MNSPVFLKLVSPNVFFKVKCPCVGCFQVLTFTTTTKEEIQKNYKYKSLKCLNFFKFNFYLVLTL